MNNVLLNSRNVVLLFSLLLASAVVLWASDDKHTEVPGLSLSVSTYHEENGEINLKMIIQNTQERPITVAVLGFPWDKLTETNFVLAHKGKIVNFRILIPLCQGRGKTVIEPGKSVSGFFALRDLSPGRYEMVGLVFCEIQRPDGSRFRIPLPFCDLSFEVLRPAGNAVEP